MVTDMTIGLIYTIQIKHVYRMARNIGGELNSAVWRLGKRLSNLNLSNLNAIYANKDMHVLCTYVHIKFMCARILYVGRQE